MGDTDVWGHFKPLSNMRIPPYQSRNPLFTEIHNLSIQRSNKLSLNADGPVGNQIDIKQSESLGLAIGATKIASRLTVTDGELTARVQAL